MDKDDKTWRDICYAALGLLACYVGFRMIDTLGVQFSWSDRYDRVFPIVQKIGAALIGVLTVWWVCANQERREFHLSAVGELRKVSWPTAPQTKQMTAIVVVVVAIFAVILAIFDIIWAKILTTLIG